MANKMPSITIDGADGLIELLRTLPDKEILPAVNKGMRAVGSKVIRDARRRLTKGHGVQSGQLKKSLGIRKVKTYKSEGRVVMYLGPRRGFQVGTVILGSKKIKKTGYKKLHDPFSIGHLIEFGHKASGWNAGGPDVPAKPFLRPAVDANKSEFNKQMAEKIAAVLVKARAKSGK